MKVLILSDIHGNLNALTAVLDDVKNDKVDACILLGDLIDYGMHSNEVIKMIKELKYPVVCNIRGNHEDAILNENYDRFSSDRGRESALHTRRCLNESSWYYIQNVMSDVGKTEFTIDGKRCLAVHGSLKDVFWKSIEVTDDFANYSCYDYVFSGHSHLPHYFEKYFTVNDIAKRNKKKVIFINPGSVGQPRNLNSCAQYAILDTENEELKLKKTRYNIKEEQKSFDDSVDEFYKLRLTEGI